MNKSSKWLIFILLAISQFMIVLDIAITNVAIPAIKVDLDFQTSALQWIITAYTITFGGFLLLGGRAADLFGRKRVLLIGMISFTAVSLLIGLSQSAVMLIVLRALQGLAGAFMSPAALSILIVTFDEGFERNKALGYWTLIATGGAAVGLLLGGVLTQYLNWRWDFFVNVPIGIIVSWAIVKVIPAHEREEKRTSLDLPGAILATLGLITLVFGFSQAPSWGWASVNTIGTFLAAIVLLAWFVYNESVAKHPLMPLGIFRIRNVTGANLMMWPVTAAMLGMFFLTSLYIQTILGYSPVKTGIAFIPFPIVASIISVITPRLVHRYGYKPFLILGPTLTGLAMLLLFRLPVNGNYFTDLLPTFLIMPIGVGMTFMPVIAAATAGVPPHEAGLASGLINTSQQMGSALGLAVLSGIAASVTKSSMSLGVQGAIVHGYDQAFLVGVGFIILSIILASTVIKEQKREQQTVAQPSTMH